MIRIPGVTLNVYKQGRLIDVAEDGSMGKLYSGHVVLDATVDPGVPCFGFIRQGSDECRLQRDWAAPGEPKKPFQKEMQAAVAARGLPSGSKVYGIKMPVEASTDGQGESFVSYPNNMLCIAGLVLNGSSPTNLMNVWKVAVVSQGGNFFLTVQLAYDRLQCVDRDGPTFPRLERHQSFNNLLADWMLMEQLVRPELVIPSGAEYVEEPELQVPHDLQDNEGVVESFYQARGVGTIITYVGDQRITARVGWRDAPKRPLRQFLVPGERVTYEKLDEPFVRSGGRFSTPRQTSFAKQAYGISLV